MKNQIGLNAEKAQELSDKLNDLLANYQMFYQNLRGFHWNIKGKEFFELHVKFEELYTEALTNIDEIDAGKGNDTVTGTDNNDFIIRVHLGFPHYASAIYTTALCNLKNHNPNLKWFKEKFIDEFAYGLLQINFLANLTLVDYKDPIAEKTIYLRAKQSLPLIR